MALLHPLLELSAVFLCQKIGIKEKYLTREPSPLIPVRLHPVVAIPLCNSAELYFTALVSM